jgi:hypothetical protein
MESITLYGAGPIAKQVLEPAAIYRKHEKSQSKKLGN